MPGWTLNLPEMRAKAREYLVEVDPDFVVLSPPWGSWDQTRVCNQGVPWQTRELQTLHTLLANSMAKHIAKRRCTHI